MHNSFWKFNKNQSLQGSKKEAQNDFVIPLKMKHLEHEEKHLPIEVPMDKFVFFFRFATYWNEIIVLMVSKLFRCQIQFIFHLVASNVRHQNLNRAIMSIFLRFVPSLAMSFLLRLWIVYSLVLLECRSLVEIEKGFRPFTSYANTWQCEHCNFCNNDRGTERKQN